MKILDSSIKKALVLGIMSGMRTTAGLLFLRSLTNKSKNQPAPMPFLEKKPVNAGIALLGITDVAVDKIPKASDFIAKSGPILKAGAGALCGGVIFQAEGKKVLTGALIGSLAAVASTYLFDYLRKSLWEKTDIPAPLLKATEDALVSAGGMVVQADLPTA